MYQHPLLRSSVFAALALMLASSARASDPLDILNTDKMVSSTPSGRFISDEPSDTPCKLNERPNILDLRNAIEWALCRNPKTAEAWANVKVQAAAVGLGRAAYLPTLSATGQVQREKSSTAFNGNNSKQDYGYSALVRSEQLSLNWVLYDFGGRSASLRNANELLAVAHANQDVILQEVLLTVARDYYAAQAAQGLLDSAREIVRNAQETDDVTLIRVTKGVAPISDHFQAQTAYLQAVYKRAKAEGDLQSTLGTLAADMNLKPSVGLTMPAMDQGGIVPDPQFKASVSDLIDLAERSHPSVLAAQSQLDAAVAKVAMARAQGMPQLSLVGKYTHSHQPSNLGLGADSEVPARANDRYIGIQVTVPLFEGFARVYQVRQAQAQSEVQRAVLSEAVQKAGLDVWKSYQFLRTSTQNLETTASLVKNAEQAFMVVRDRYALGVGNIIELLNVQSSLADANQQRIQALADWRVARLDLAAKLGTLSIVDI